MHTVKWFRNILWDLDLTNSLLKSKHVLLKKPQTPVLKFYRALMV